MRNNYFHFNQREVKSPLAMMLQEPMLSFYALNDSHFRLSPSHDLLDICTQCLRFYGARFPGEALCTQWNVAHNPCSRPWCRTSSITPWQSQRELISEFWTSINSTLLCCSSKLTVMPVKLSILARRNDGSPVSRWSKQKRPRLSPTAVEFEVVRC